MSITASDASTSTTTFSVVTTSSAVTTVVPEDNKSQTDNNSAASALTASKKSEKMIDEQWKQSIVQEPGRLSLSYTHEPTSYGSAHSDSKALITSLNLHLMKHYGVDQEYLTINFNPSYDEYIPQETCNTEGLGHLLKRPVFIRNVIVEEFLVASGCHSVSSRHEKSFRASYKFARIFPDFYTKSSFVHICEVLQAYGVPEAVVKDLSERVRTRKRSQLEKDFYKALPALTKDNASTLLPKLRDMAIRLDIESRNFQYGCLRGTLLGSDFAQPYYVDAALFALGKHVALNSISDEYQSIFSFMQDENVFKRVAYTWKQNHQLCLLRSENDKLKAANKLNVDKSREELNSSGTEVKSEKDKAVAASTASTQPQPILTAYVMGTTVDATSTSVMMSTSTSRLATTAPMLASSSASNTASPPSL